ncbi:dynamin family protein [Helicobacter mesocricetorum]|uniref:dynamin family protein n=1 Tax=Helicobacter mesocricetorum TaxID=87012 RepID=UPI000CF07BF8|nr:dynamin family protein [Helicobacter mesocricetorum]
MLEVYMQQCQEILEANAKKTPLQKFIFEICENLNPNDYSLEFIQQLQNQPKEPLQIAVIGQFSSGKSTFLNALLGQSILPTGVTPITSKVCKICYGDEYILEVLYKDGRRFLHDVEFFQSLGRQNSEDVDYFCLYAPLLFLKGMNFLDTPGFNSQNSEDTLVTQRILENVDGIIWLTLIDNAGKNSEKLLLKETIKHYAQKSLCVLNQKDRLKNEEEIQISVAYAQNAFEGIFAKIIPVSAKEALKARLNTEKKILESFFLKISHHITNSPKTQESLDLFEDYYKKKKEGIEKEISSLKENESLMEESNMPLIFDFFNEIIKPQANITKEYGVLRKLKEMHIRLHLQYHKIYLCYGKLQKILNNHYENTSLQCAKHQEEAQKKFNDIYRSLDLLLDSLAQKIYTSLEKTHFSYEIKQKGIFTQKIHKHSKEAFILPLEQLQISLQNIDTQLVKDFKALSVQIRNFYGMILGFITEFSNALKAEIQIWINKEIKKQEIYKYAPNNQALKDLEEFSQNHYEKILADFFSNDLKVTSYLQSELFFLSHFMSVNYNNCIFLVLNTLDLKIKNALQKFQENPMEFALFVPTLENIREVLNSAFCFEQFQARLFGPMNLLKKTYSQFNANLQEVVEDKIANIESEKFKIKEEIHTISKNLGKISEFSKWNLSCFENAKTD